MGLCGSSDQSIIFSHDNHHLIRDDGQYHWVWRNNKHGESSMKVIVTTGRVDEKNYKTLRTQVGAGQLIIKRGSEYKSSVKEYVPSCPDPNIIYYQIRSHHPVSIMTKTFYIREVKPIR